MESFYRKKIKDIPVEKKFQVLSWETYDEEIDDDPDDLEYVIYMFGVTDIGNSICVKINNYTPYFFVKIPEAFQKSWNEYKTTEVKNFLCKKLYRQKKSLLKISVVERKDINGFTNDKLFKFLKIVTKNEKTFKKCRYILSPYNGQRKPVIPLISPMELNFEIYEANIEPFIRFCHIRNIKMASWCSISKYSLEENSRCQIDISCKWNAINPIESTDVSKLVIASYDIECISERAKQSQKNIFPDYSLITDMITQIGTTFYRFGTNEVVEHMCSLNSPTDNSVDEVENVVVELYDTEEELIKGWIKLMRNTDVDIITGYNINGFDWKYIYERVKILNIESSITGLSRLKDVDAFYKEDELISSAYGENLFKYIKIPGIFNSDLHTIIKREQKLESYKLNHVAKIHIGDQKDDLTPLDIFNLSRGSSSDIATVIKYCVKDCTLVINLIKKLCIVTNIIGMSNVTWVPISYIESRGQQIKVHSQLLYEARLNDYLVPTLPYKAASDVANEEKFTGATVLDAEAAAHFDQIAGLDFASLYPSIMIAKNLSYETLVKHPEFDNLPSVDYNDVIWKEDEGTDKERTETVRFVQHKKGILPIMLEKLWTERKSIKKQMKVIKAQLKDLGSSVSSEEKAKLEFQYAVFDGFQLAMKVSMNSIYGFTGANLGRLPEKRIAASVTAEGRKMIRLCKEHVETTYNCKVVYGDSVAHYTPIIVKIGNFVNVIEIEELETLFSDNGNTWKRCHDSNKQYIDFGNLNIMTWTELGWTKLHRVIRHKLPENKKMVRTITRNGIVDTTDDHSLLLENKSEISPNSLKCGDRLLSKKFNHKDHLRNEEYFKISCDSQIKAAIAFFDAQSTGYDVSIYYDNDKYVITNNHSLEKHNLRSHDKKNEVLDFFNIPYDNNDYVYDLTTDNNHFAAGVGNLIVHNTDSIYVKFDTPYEGQAHMDEVFRLSEVAADSCSKLFKKPIDLEFEKVMWPFILFSKKRYACVIYTNPHTHDYIDYKGIQVVRRDNCPLIKEKSKEIFECILLERDIPKGIQLAKKYTKKLLDGDIAIKDLIISKSLKGYGSYEFDKQVVCKACSKRWYSIDDTTNKKVYKIPMNPKKKLEENLRDFISSDHYCYTCKKDTEYRNNQANIAHVALARKMEQRDKYNCPQVGERVPYVFKKTDNKRDLQFSKVEDPDYVIKNCIELDYEYYFEHQLKSAIDTIFGPILKEKLYDEVYAGILPEKVKTKRKIKETK